MHGEDLTPDEQQVRDLAHVKGFVFKKLGQQRHSFKYSLVDRQSNSIRAEHEDLNIIRKFLERHPGTDWQTGVTGDSR